MKDCQTCHGAKHHMGFGPIVTLPNGKEGRYYSGLKACTDCSPEQKKP